MRDVRHPAGHTVAKRGPILAIRRQQTPRRPPGALRPNGFSRQGLVLDPQCLVDCGVLQGGAGAGSDVQGIAFGGSKRGGRPFMIAQYLANRRPRVRDAMRSEFLQHASHDMVRQDRDEDMRHR